MAFQFIHVESVGRAASKMSRTRRLTLREVAAEAMRAPGHCPHIECPAPPVLLHGIFPDEAAREAEEAAGEARDRGGRHLRKDAQIALVGVASFPVRLALASPDERHRYDAWERAVIVWLVETHGARLRSVVRHEDEAFGHIHFVVVPDLAHGEYIEAVHPGRAAILAAKAAGVTSRRELDQRFRGAMRGFQDDFYGAVGARHGLARLGPGRRRLSRAAWRAETSAAEHGAEILRDRDAATTAAAELSGRVSDLGEALRETGAAKRAAEERVAELGQAAIQLTTALAVERSGRGEAEARLALEATRRAASEVRVLLEASRADVLQRLLSEAQRRAGAVAAQAIELLRAITDPARVALLPRRPDWLAEPDWMTLTRQVARALLRSSRGAVAVASAARLPSSRRPVRNADHTR